jgi:hypothetical protein
VKQDAGTAFNRFRNDPSFQRGFESGGSLLVQGSVVVGRYGRAVSEAPYNAEAEREASIEQECALEEWALENHCWVQDIVSSYHSLGFKFYGYGGEAQVYAEGDKYVHKICRIEQYDSLQRFFDRIVIQNAMCPAASLLVEGFGRNADEDFVVLMRQQFFRQAHLMNEKEISLYMRCLGFRKIVDESYGTISYLSDIVIVEDLHPGNIWMTDEGNVVIIDGAFFFNTPNLGRGGRFAFEF